MLFDDLINFVGIGLDRVVMKSPTIETRSGLCRHKRRNWEANSAKWTSPPQSLLGE